MSYLAIEEYHVRFQQGDDTVDGRLWVREDEEWEVAVGHTTERLRAAATPDQVMDPHSLFGRLVDTLAQHDTQLLSCGSCAHFRRAPNSHSTGWMGYCSYRGEGADAPAYPGEVALLAPNCQYYEPSAPDQPTAEIDRLERESDQGDPEATKALPTVAEKSKGGLFGKLRGLLNLEREAPEVVRAGGMERPGGQPCPACGTRMTNRASVANMDDGGEERVLSVWRCPHCYGNYLDDWFEAWVGSRSRDAERLYVVPPVEANAGAAIVVHCPRPDVKGCTCIANQHFDKWGNALESSGRRIQARESVVSL